jgi:hypothetical protein
MLIHKQDVVLEASVEMWLEAQVAYDWVVVAVDMGIYSVQAFEELAQGCRKMLRKGDSDARREGCFVVNVRLYPGHQVLDIFGGRHFGRALVGIGILPEVFESVHA